MVLLWSWLPVLFWASLIFYLSGIPSLDSGLGEWDTILRKCAHITEYAVLAFLTLRACHRTWPDSNGRTLWVGALVFGCLYAISDEWHQSFVPGRGPSLADVGFDSVGVCLGVFLFNSSWLAGFRWR